ncbi:hypothetical protein D3D02_17815 [Halobellus sp. Atlit-38R]|uniref:DUF6338 family protein n=1 Tax=Halobellus sp. Atlit-38R TaxID=2282131 RepID=UPI000EF1F545|nr:DUF6338 family protein [Halobellus sp. Atlit-38R]RLM83529.1 hypothetical protein D3D02_17815 [Halobellus sp. Atlit-38R]
MASTSVAGQLTFFLFLLIPGYAGVRAYLWANIAVDDATRLTKLVWMTIGGFGSIVVVAVFREAGLQLSLSLASGIAIPGELTVQSVGNLSILQAANLIGSQVAIALFGGLLVGSSRYILIDADGTRRRDLTQPWDEIFNHISRGDEITIVSHSGEKITGTLEQMGNSNGDRDIVLSDPRKTYIDGQNNPENERFTELGRLSYHHTQDISRIEAYQEKADSDRGWTNRQYMNGLQKGRDFRAWIARGLKNRYLELIEWYRGMKRSDDDGAETDSDGTLDLEDQYQVPTSDESEE